ncbi:MAG: Pyrophosphatase [Parcubacteria bacterium 33_209]|nr:MAG: Pyrophosphatase [Parcubacteria bacterium 33_209]
MASTIFLFHIFLNILGCIISYGPVHAYRKKKDDLGEELADVAIYLMGLSEMLGFDLEEEIAKKVVKNEKRKYESINGVNTKIEG